VHVFSAKRKGKRARIDRLHLFSPKLQELRKLCMYLALIHRGLGRKLCIYLALNAEAYEENVHVLSAKLQELRKLCIYLALK